MDEMKIKLSSGLMKGIVSKLITKAIFKKFCIKPDIELNDISLEKVGSKIHIHINADATIDESDLLKITRLSEMEEPTKGLFYFWIREIYKLCYEK